MVKFIAISRVRCVEDGTELYLSSISPSKSTVNVFFFFFSVTLSEGFFIDCRNGISGSARLFYGFGSGLRTGEKFRVGGATNCRFGL